MKFPDGAALAIIRQIDHEQIVPATFTQKLRVAQATLPPAVLPIPLRVFRVSASLSMALPRGLGQGGMRVVFRCFNTVCQVYREDGKTCGRTGIATHNGARRRRQ